MVPNFQEITIISKTFSNVHEISSWRLTFTTFSSSQILL